MAAQSLPAAPPKNAGLHTLASRSVRLLPPWVLANVRSPRTWKTFVRCWLVTWTIFVLLLPERSGNALGNAGFIGLIAAFLVPPSMPIQLFIFLMTTMVVGMSMGWALGAAAMKAALAARSQVLLDSQFLRANESAAGAANPDAVYNVALFQGAFLDWRSSIVFGAFYVFSAFMFATIRAYVPRLTLLCVFGTIVADVFFTFGPLFPVASYTIVSTFFISVGCYVAIALVCIVMIFPETMSHAHLDAVSALLKILQKFLEGQDALLAETPEQIARGVKDRSGAVGRNAGLRGRIMMSLQTLTMKNAFVEAEFSWGRWNGSDCKAIEDPLKLLVTRIGAFQAFPRLVSTYISSLSTLRSATWTSMSPSSSQVVFNPASKATISHPEGIDTEKIVQFAFPQRDGNLSLSAALPRLRAATAPLRRACTSALGACCAVIEDVNRRRWPWSRRRPHADAPAHADLEAALDAAIASLRQERAAFVHERRLALVAPFASALPPHAVSDSALARALHATPALRALVIACSFAAQLVGAADTVLVFAELVRATCAKRRKSRLWAPRGLRALGNWLVRRNRDGEGDGVEKSMGEEVRPESGVEGREEGESYKRDPDSRPPTNVFQKAMDLNHWVYMWSKTPEAIFIWKYLVVSILLWLPSVFSTSAHFYYVEKGVWALIMAQTVMNIYVSDQLYNLVARIFGTFLGMVAGLLVWYIGNGSGSGNPYGLAASFGVFLIPYVYLRISLPPSAMAPFTMFSVTLGLILGYSWVDGHLVTVSNPSDIGWPIAWKRGVLVLIGCGASFVVMMIPPTSGRKAVRLRNAAIISEIGSLYALLMAVWINEEDRSRGRFASASTIIDGQNGKAGSDEEKAPGHATHVVQLGEHPHEALWSAGFRRRILALGQQLGGLRAQTAVARWEGSVRGAWPVEEYMALVEREGDMLPALAQLSSALSRIDSTWRKALIRETLVLNPDFITEVMTVFSLVSQSLRTGEPLQQIVPSSLVDRLLHHHAHARAQDVVRGPTPKASMNSMASEGNGNAYASSGIEEEAEAEEEAEEDGKDVYEQRIRDVNFMYFASGVAAVSQIVSSLDGLHRTTKTLCGEVPFEGFEEWRREYARVRRSI